MNLPSRGTIFTSGLAASLTIVLSLTTTAFAEDKKEKPLMMGATASMLSNTCAGCHGPNGVSAGPSMPSLAGLSSTYIADMMDGFKSGDIPSTIMDRIAKGYTSEEFALMGEFFAKQTFVAAKQESDAEKAKKGAELHEKHCASCHTESGTVADDDAGILKGQWKVYLADQMVDFQSGDREAPKKMARALKKVEKEHGPEGIEALIEYYGSK